LTSFIIIIREKRKLFQLIFFFLNRVFFSLSHNYRKKYRVAFLPLLFFATPTVLFSTPTFVFLLFMLYFNLIVVEVVVKVGVVGVVGVKSQPSRSKTNNNNIIKSTGVYNISTPTPYYSIFF